MVPAQCSAGVIEIADLCAQGQKFSWSWYFLTTLFEDVMLAQQKEGHKFYYSWLLILISFTVWANPTDYVQMDFLISCLGGKYHNLWEDKAGNKHQQNTNVVFFLHAEALR